MRLVVVTAAYDDEADVWYVEESNVPGLRAEAPSMEALRARLPGLVEDLVEINNLDFHGKVPIDRGDLSCKDNGDRRKMRGYAKQVREYLT